MGKEPIVTVLIICYNHGKYIEQCLDSVLAQKTEYPFEILIHDDASTDDSREIIKRYEKEHPDLIRTILQSERFGIMALGVDAAEGLLDERQ